MGLSYDANSLCIIICAILSVLGCLFILISASIFKKLNTYSFRLIAYLSIADLIASFSFLIPSHYNNTLCLSQAISQNYSQLSSLFITGIISFSLFEMIVKENTQISKNEKYYITLSFIIPALLTPLPLITDSYGDSNGWCWVTYKGSIDTFWMVLQFYGPLALTLLINIYFYFRIYKKVLYDKNLGQNENIVNKLMNRLKMYPIVLLVCFGPSLLHRVYYILEKEDNTYLNVIAGSLNALYGFINALVYGFTTKVKKTIKSAFTKLCAPKNALSVNTHLFE